MEGRFSVKLEVQYVITGPKYMLLDKETNQVADNMTKEWIKEIYNGEPLDRFSWYELYYWNMTDSKEIPVEVFLVLS